MKFEEDDTVAKMLLPKLNKIGWDLHDYGCDHYRIVTHKGLVTPFVIWKDRLQLETKDFPGYGLAFYLKEEDVRERDTFISIGPKHYFINLMNHDMKENKK